MFTKHDVELKPNTKYLYVIALALPMCPLILEQTIDPVAAMALKDKIEEQVKRLPAEARKMVDFQFYAIDLIGLAGEIPDDGNPCKELLGPATREDGQLDVTDDVKAKVADLLANFNPEGKAN